MFENSGVFVFLIKSDEHAKKTGIIRKLSGHRICYVCLSDTASSAEKALGGSGIDVKGMCFIDTLSSHYSRQESTGRFIYVSSPSAIDEISRAISAMKKKCDAFVFDDISCLLRYHEPSSVLRFTNGFRTRSPGRMVYIVSVDAVPESIGEFVDDLMMFSDETTDLTGMHAEERVQPGPGDMNPHAGAEWPYGMSGPETGLPL